MQTPEQDFQNITQLLQEYGIDTQENRLKVSMNIWTVLQSWSYRNNPEVQKIFQEVRKSWNIQKLNNLYQILSVFDRWCYNGKKNTPVISIFQKYIPKLLDFLSWTWSKNVLDNLEYFIGASEHIFQEIFSFSQLQEFISPWDCYEDIKIKLTQKLQLSENNEVQKILSLLEWFEKMLQDIFQGVMKNHDETTFSFFQSIQIINQFSKMKTNLKPDKTLSFYISLSEVALNYFSQKQKDEKQWVSKAILWNMIFQYTRLALTPNISDLEWFLWVVVYAFWDGTHQKWWQFIEQIEKIYEKNYAWDKEKKDRLLWTFRQFLCEKKQADFYMFAINDFSQTLWEFQMYPKKTFLENPENMVSSFRFSPYEGTPWKKAEYVGAMNINPEMQWYGIQWLMNQIIFERIKGIFWKENSKVINADNSVWLQNIWNIENVDEFYAHVIADTSVERLWRKIGFVATWKEEEIYEDGKKQIRREIVLTKEAFLQRYKKNTFQ